MNEIVSDLGSPAWWFSTIIVALVVNIVAGLAVERIKVLSFPSGFRNQLQLSVMVHAVLAATSGLFTIYVFAFVAEADSAMGRLFWLGPIVLMTLLMPPLIFGERDKKVIPVIMLAIFVCVFAYGIWWSGGNSIFIPMAYFYAAAMSMIVVHIGDKFNQR